MMATVQKVTVTVYVRKETNKTLQDVQFYENNQEWGGVMQSDMNQS